MKKLALAAMFAATLVVHAQEPAKDRFVVHEWGTFTAVYGADGTMMDWRPLTTSDLPRFVYDRATVAPVVRVNEKKNMVQSKQRMETPVLYFYAGKEMTVDVSVGFPQGLITEWYPRVRDFRPALGDGIKPVAVKDGWVRWGNVRIVPRDTKVELPKEGEASHYYHARETDADYVRVCGEDGQKVEFEKFLFYRGIGNFPLPMTVKAVDGRLSIANPSARDLGAAFAITVHADGSGQYLSLGSIKKNAAMDVVFPKQALSKADLIPGISRELQEALTKAGLYSKEAASMVKTWTDSYFEQEGTRILYLLPEALTNELLPLTISPAPTEVKRILVARIDILTPEQTAALQSLLRDLGSDAFEARDAAQKKIQNYGRFAEPALQEVVRTTTDAEIKSRAQELLGRMAPKR